MSAGFTLVSNSTDYVGKVYPYRGEYLGHTYGRYIGAGGFETFEGAACMVGPFKCAEQCKAAVRAQNWVEKSRYTELASRPFAADGSIPGASANDVAWMRAVAKYKPAWLTWGRGQ